MKKIARNSVAAKQIRSIRKRRNITHTQRANDSDILCVYSLSLFLWSFQTSWVESVVRADCVPYFVQPTNQRTNTKTHREWTVITTLHNVNTFDSNEITTEFKIYSKIRSSSRCEQSNQNQFILRIFWNSHSSTFLCLQEVNH